MPTRHDKIINDCKRKVCEDVGWIHQAPDMNQCLFPICTPVNLRINWYLFQTVNPVCFYMIHHDRRERQNSNAHYIRAVSRAALLHTILKIRWNQSFPATLHTTLTHHWAPRISRSSPFIPFIHPPSHAYFLASACLHIISIQYDLSLFL